MSSGSISVGGKLELEQTRPIGKGKRQFNVLEMGNIEENQGLWGKTN